MNGFCAGRKRFERTKRLDFHETVVTINFDVAPAVGMRLIGENFKTFNEQYLAGQIADPAVCVEVTDFARRQGGRSLQFDEAVVYL